MLDEDSKKNIRKHINTLCNTALVVIETLGDEDAADLSERLEQTAKAIAEHYDMEPELMEELHAMLMAARRRNALNQKGISYIDAEHAKDMVYALCDELDDPKEIMRHVRTADEMMSVWESEK